MSIVIFEVKKFSCINYCKYFVIFFFNMIYEFFRYYMKDKLGKKLINCLYVDLFYKWVGGGLLFIIINFL